MSAAASAMETQGLVRRFGWAPALRGVSLRIDWGERVALLGPNGAGKSTLLKILATVLRPTEGSARVAGQDVVRDSAAVRRYVGFVGHQTSLYAELTVEENLAFSRQVYGAVADPAYIEDVLQRCGLWERRRERVGTLSRGLQQRAAITRALVHDPPLLLLDEPDSGLDDTGLSWLARLLAEQRRTVLLTSHAPERAREWCRRLVVLVGGRLAYDGPAAATGSATLRHPYPRGGVPAASEAGR